MSASQRTDGTGRVDIVYSMADGVGNIAVSIKVSSDNGSTWGWSPNPSYVSGHIGDGVPNGINHHIVWDMRSDRPGVCWPECRIRIEARDEAAGIGDERTLMLPSNVPLVLVYIPSGSFFMGRYPGERDSASTEDPQHTVTVTSGFWMGKYEITQQQWMAVMGSWPATAPSTTYGLGNHYPAYYVSWIDAQNFISTLNTYIAANALGAPVRLPTEAEWEYACRSGTETRFYWGDDGTYSEMGFYAWYSGNSGDKTNAVGGKEPNAFWLHDMSGNVWEWCQDWYGAYTSAPVSDPSGPATGTHRVFRGGSWNYDHYKCRAAHRGSYPPEQRYFNGGFRLVQGL